MCKEKLTFKQDRDVILPISDKTFPIAFKDWERLMDRIENCGDSTHKYESLAWTCIGICASAFLSAASLPFSVEFVKKISEGTEANIPAIITEVVFIVTGVATAVLTYFSFQFAK